MADELFQNFQKDKNIDSIIQKVEENKLIVFQEEKINIFVSLCSKMNENSFNQDADSLIKKLLNTYKDNVKLLTEHSKVKFILKEYNEAIKIFEKLLNLNPSESEKISLDMGICYYMKDDINEAMNIFNKIIEKKPLYTEALINLGLCYKIQKNYIKALGYYEKALETTPNDSDLYNNIGTLYYAQEKYEDACVNFLKALEKTPEDEEILCNLGIALSKSKQINYAWLAFDEALKIDPRSKKILLNYVICLLQIKQFEKANTIINHFKSIMNASEKKQFAQIIKDFKSVYQDRGISLLDRNPTGKESLLHKVIEERKISRQISQFDGSKKNMGEIKEEEI